MFSFRKRAFAFAASIVVLGAALAGCGGGDDGDQGASGGGTLTIGTLIPPTTFAANDARWANDSPYLQAVYDTLLRAAPDESIEPSLATKWSYNDDKTVLTMTLRDDVTFTDGTKFDATVAAKNLLRFRDGTSPQKGYLASIKDAQAVDPTTLKITLTAPNPALLSFLTQNPGLQQSPATFDSPDASTKPVGSGPYIYDAKASVVGSTYVFTQNKDYWALELQHYDKIVMSVYSTATAVLNAIKGGQINGAPITDSSMVEEVEASGFTSNKAYGAFFSVPLWDRKGALVPALADVRVRRAINYAFDKPALLKAVDHGHGEITSSIFAKGTSAFDPALDDYYTYNPTKARELLREAGYGDGDITITMAQPGSANATMFALVKQYLGDIGIKVKLVSVSAERNVSDLLAAKFSANAMVLKAPPTTWETLTLDLLPTAAWNPFHVEDATVTRLAKEVQTGSEKEADAAAKELNKYIVEQAFFAPWYRLETVYATDSKTSVKTQPGNYYPYLWNFEPTR